MFLKALCKRFLCYKESPAVCVFSSPTADLLPRKVKVTAVKHRLGCRLGSRLGLCSFSHLACFTFRDIRGASHDGRFSWTSRCTSINMKQLLRHRFDDSAKLSITWRRGFPRKFPPVYIPMHTFIELLTLQEPCVFNICFDSHFSPSASPSITDNLEAEEDRPRQVGDVFTGLLGDSEVVCVAEGQNVPLVADCELRAAHHSDPGYQVPVMLDHPRWKQRLREETEEREQNCEAPRREEKQEKVRNCQDPRKEEQEKLRKDGHDLTEERTSLGREGTCSGEGESERKDEEQQRETSTAVEGTVEVNGAGKNHQHVVRAPASAPPLPVTSTRGPVGATWVLRQRLLCVVVAVLAVVMVLAALEPCLSDLEEYLQY